jgi:hypothetical protein
VPTVRTAADHAALDGQNDALDQLNIRDFGSFPAVGSQTAELQPWDGRDEPNFATPEAGRYTTRDPGACQRSRGRSFLPDAGAGSVTKLVIPLRLCGGETVRAVTPGPVISRQPDRISTKPLIFRASVVSWAPSADLWFLAAAQISLIPPRTDPRPGRRVA